MGHGCKNAVGWVGDGDWREAKRFGWNMGAYLCLELSDCVAAWYADSLGLLMGMLSEGMKEICSRLFLCVLILWERTKGERGLA